MFGEARDRQAKYVGLIDLELLCQLIELNQLNSAKPQRNLFERRHGFIVMEFVGTHWLCERYA